MIAVLIHAGVESIHAIDETGNQTSPYKIVATKNELGCEGYPYYLKGRIANEYMTERDVRAIHAMTGKLLEQIDGGGA